MPIADDDDLPGMLALAKGIAKGKWPHTMDAQVWADEFCKLNIAADKATMLGWFANAIMAGYDTAQYRAARSAPAVPTGVATAAESEDRCDMCAGSGRALYAVCISCNGSGRSTTRDRE